VRHPGLKRIRRGRAGRSEKASVACVFHLGAYGRCTPRSSAGRAEGSGKALFGRAWRWKPEGLRGRVRREARRWRAHGSQGRQGRARPQTRSGGAGYPTHNISSFSRSASRGKHSRQGLGATSYSTAQYVQAALAEASMPKQGLGPHYWATSINPTPTFVASLLEAPPRDLGLRLESARGAPPRGRPPRALHD